MKRPKKPFVLKKEPKVEYVTKSYRLPKELVHEFERIAKSEGTSASKAVAQVFKWALKAQVKK